MTITISTATFEEMDFIMNMAKEEGWNPGIYDKETFYAADPNGFFIAKKSNDQPIGCVSAVKYGNNYGFIGLYIVLPEYRKKGYGQQLREVTFNYLKGYTLGGDVVPTNQKAALRQNSKYAYANKRFEGIAQKTNYNIPLQIKTLNQIPFKELLKYDTKIFGAARENFLSKWITQPESFSYTYLDNKGEINGYGLLRKCYKGYKIGPLFAENIEIADSIYQSLMTNIIGESFYFDIPLINKEAVKIVERYNLKPVFDTARMYIGTPPKANINHTFGITTFELG